jgi:hypothetical protein
MKQAQKHMIVIANFRPRLSIIAIAGFLLNYLRRIAMFVSDEYIPFFTAGCEKSSYFEELRTFRSLFGEGVYFFPRRFCCTDPLELLQTI